MLKYLQHYILQIFCYPAHNITTKAFVFLGEVILYMTASDKFWEKHSFCYCFDHCSSNYSVFSYLNILKVWVLRNLVENLGCICLALFLLANYLHITLSFSSTNSSYICLYDTEALGSCINLLAISNHKQPKFIFSRFLKQEGKDKVSGR